MHIPTRYTKSLSGQFLPHRFLRIGDLAIFLVLLLVIVIIASRTYHMRFYSAATVRVESRDGTFIYALDENRNLAFEGPLGITEVVIEEGKVHVASSPCKNQIAVSAGKISKSGQWLINLPNEVFIFIEGGDPIGKDTIDDLAF